ncbi:hypothetical protein ACBY01_15375 [Sphingomonas sp. ac-8]|uniref:hypothetical protein n=1 Tax=Sphingomonas sp. ac-8 TaxID=3242977 RepID=UPI003A809DCB
MDEDLARILATGGTVASREIARLYDLLAQHLPGDEALRLGLVSALAEIGSKVIQPAFDAHPGLQTEFEHRIEKYHAAT